MSDTFVKSEDIQRWISNRKSDLVMEILKEKYPRQKRLGIMASAQLI